MRTIVFILIISIGILLTYCGASAQSSMDANSDSLRSSADSVQIQTKEKEQLKKFKNAFEKLVDMEKADKQETTDTSKVVTDPDLDLGGFVLDQTRSRSGRTFYELFYRQWQAPENAHYYTITISEQPTPWRGTQIIIKMNYQQILKFPLQPKYHYIEKVSKQAVAVVYQKLKKQSSIEKQLIF